MVMTIKTNLDDTISICNDKYCISASGESAKLIAVGVLILLFVGSVSALAK